MFKAIGDTLNKVTTYLFINAKAKARLKVNNPRDPHYGNCQQVSRAKAIYEKQIKRYIFGIGYFLSFIEGTDAYKAREELYSALMDTKELGGDYISRWGVLEFFLPIINSLDINTNPYKNPPIWILSETIFATGKLKYFTHPLNLFVYIGHILHFFIGLVAGMLPGKVLALPLMALYIPVFILAFFTELALMLIDTILFDPIRFVCEEIKQHYDYRDKEYLYLPTEEYKVATRIFDAFEHETVEALFEAYEGSFHRGFLREEEQFKPLSAKENTLAIVNPEKKRQCNIYAKGLFFKVYKERLSNNELTNPVLNRNDRQDPRSIQNKAIVTNYRRLENMWHFYLFHHKENGQPKDLTQTILKTCLESASQFEEEPKPPTCSPSSNLSLLLKPPTSSIVM